MGTSLEIIGLHAPVPQPVPTSRCRSLPAGLVEVASEIEAPSIHPHLRTLVPRPSAAVDGGVEAGAGQVELLPLPRHLRLVAADQLLVNRLGDSGDERPRRLQVERLNSGGECQ